MLRPVLPVSTKEIRKGVAAWAAKVVKASKTTEAAVGQKEIGMRLTLADDKHQCLEDSPLQSDDSDSLRKRTIMFSTPDERRVPGVDYGLM